MKINKSRPSHWLYLLAFTCQATLGLILRLVTERSAITLYGHKLNGNLLALYQSCDKSTFLSMDLAYCRSLHAQGIRAQWACGIGAALLLARSKALISDHGLHSLELILTCYQKTGLKCFDVWHGIPFKGFDADDFRLQHRYDATWVASPLVRKLYIERFGFEPDRVVVTGYARTDALVEQQACNLDIRKELGLPETGAVVLFAPTWSQDAAGRSLYPFGYSEANFLAALSSIAEQHDATVILRTHLNSDASAEQEHPNIKRMPSSDWPDTESILQISDILICDWSSIAFDFLLLDRPTIFLDVPPPFRKGFSLGPEFRFGPIVDCMPALTEALVCAMQSPDHYWRSHSEKHQEVKTTIYEDWADGQATQRCLAQLARACST
ncbi:CDP-glycerol glycerophosphotransferase family protein [Marinobacter sp.]|uniref:CDP-glycerol glycerophosphotransferase family protein n=1 Tax=Marinobacter sp. TaxID=50741 RepID=UPI003A8DA511